MTFAEIQNVLNKAGMDKLPKLNISILRNIMIESMVPYFRFAAYQIGFDAKIKIGEYDNIVQEALGMKAGILTKDTDGVLIFMKMENLSWNLARNFAELKTKDVNNEVTRIKDTIISIIHGIRNQTDGMILWHSFELPLYPGLGVCDLQSESGQVQIIQKLNDFLRTTLAVFSNTYYVDLNCCISRLGGKIFYDNRYWHMGRAPYSLEALNEVVNEDFKFIRALKGKNKKCLVLDCDNVLWGGIVGENDLTGIKLSTTYPGSPYYEFQQEILNLYNRGILIALCSKNNSEDVWEVFRNHPDMLLKEKHIAAAEINWDDKATNLKKIAMNLNIGLDSLVFIDDSEFEINLVREILPEVMVIHLPKEQTFEYRNILVSCGVFDTLTISAEDQQRGEMYKTEKERKELLGKVRDLGTYLKSLEMVVEIGFVDNFTLPRVAQLTQKTNQFNLTTKRYSEADIKKYMESKDADILSLKVSDKFGDLGIVGVCILQYVDKKAVFDTFLLSCRALGRGVEDIFVIEALKLAKKKGCEIAVGEFYPTPKNGQVKEFYLRQNFKETPNPNNFIFYLDQTSKKELPHFKEINSPVESII